MYRAAVRTASRQALGGVRPQAFQRSSRRFASSVPASRPRSFKSSLLRWGLAVGAVYFYNTSSVFAEEAAVSPSSFADSDLPTVNSVIEQKQKQLQTKLDEQQRPAETKSSQAPTSHGKASPESQSTAVAESPGALEEEAGQEGAFNPETGEINWDCPCLGGMAQGPCGEEFKTAFSCFVYSTEEPKGMDCIEKFQAMQGCFRQYPDIYGAELADDDDDDDNAGQEVSAEGQQVSRQEHDRLPLNDDKLQSNDVLSTKSSVEGGVPRKWEDATDADANDANHGQPGKKAEADKTE